MPHAAAGILQPNPTLPRTQIQNPIGRPVASFSTTATRREGDSGDLPGTSHPALYKPSDLWGPSLVCKKGNQVVR